jgi:hypothetical protein
VSRGPRGRARPYGQLGYRGVHERGTPGSCRDRTGSHPQVRRRLPRPRRRAAARGREWSRHPRDPRIAWRPQGIRGARPPGALQRPRGRGGPLRASRGRDRMSDRRAGGGQHGLHPSGAWLPRGAAGAVRPVRRAARVRRGDHGLPRRLRGRPAALWRHARPHLPRQGDRRRLPRRRLRWAPRPDGTDGARGTRLPGGDPVREPARDGGRRSDASRAGWHWGLRAARSHGLPARRRPRRARSRGRRGAHDLRGRRDVRLLLPPRARASPSRTGLRTWRRPSK